jgi:hypothetical protein
MPERIRPTKLAHCARKSDVSSSGPRQTAFASGQARSPTVRQQRHSSPFHPPLAFVFVKLGRDHRRVDRGLDAIEPFRHGLFFSLKFLSLGPALFSLGLSRSARSSNSKSEIRRPDSPAPK